MDLTKFLGQDSQEQSAQRLSKEEYAAQKKQEREEIWGMIDGKAQEVFQNGDSLKGFLDFMGQCKPQRTDNLFLLYAQNPEIRQVKTFEKWKEEGKVVEHNFRVAAEALDRCTQRSLLIVVDTHSTSFVESQEVLKAIPRVVVIDHHRMMVTHIENAIIFYHEPYASSASEMVAELVQYINSSALNKKEATALLSGIMLDTKNFVLKTGVRTFEASAYLKRRGADTVEVKKMFANSLDTYKERSQLGAGAEVYKGCAIACSNWEFPNVRIAAAQAADELLSIQGVRASFVIFRVGNEIAISARSLGDVNVQILLEEFGGGGHLNMAGAQIKNSTTNDVRKALIRVLNEKLSEATKKNN